VVDHKICSGFPCLGISLEKAKESQNSRVFGMWMGFGCECGWRSQPTMNEGLSYVNFGEGFS